MNEAPHAVGRYQIRGLLGQGAMAEVYRAYDPDIGRELAVKLLKPELCRDKECAARFLREAKAAGALSHPNIVTIFDVGQSEDRPYIAMELLDGSPLDQVVKERGKLDIASILSIGVQLADALHYAHALGVVHRDIKPSNIALGADGRTVKVLDFGIARVSEGAGQEDENLKTQIGQVIGTPRYMSPEQALGLELDGRSDLFSVGVILYELVTGCKAFAGATPAALALQITQQDPTPIRALDQSCPEGLRCIIAKLMQKRRDKRYAHGGELAAAMRHEQHACLSLAADLTTRRRLPLALKSTLIVAGVTGLVLLLGAQVMVGRQYAAMQRVAISSGTAIATFVANNASLTAADNATLPAKQRDWQPVSAFVTAASDDPNIASIIVVDNEGVVRGASQPSLIGKPYQKPAGEKLIQQAPNTEITDVAGLSGSGFRFVQDITYGKAVFGKVDVVVREADLAAAAHLSWMLLLGLIGATMAVVVAATFMAAREVAKPLTRLKAGLRAMALGDLEARISHSRRDEFGELFDLFNRLGDNVQQSMQSAGASSMAAEETRINPAPSQSPRGNNLNVATLLRMAAGALERTRLNTPAANSNGETQTHEAAKPAQLRA